MSTPVLYDPFPALLDALDRTGEPPPGWVEQHAPGEDLRPAWQACNFVESLLKLAGAGGDPRGVVVAACACIRVRYPLLPEDGPDPRPTLAAAEAWAREEGALAAVEDARRAADLPRAGPHRALSRALHWLGSAVCATNPASAGLYAANVANVVMMMGSADADALRAASAQLSAVVRAHLTCPTLEQLRGAYRRA